MKYPILCFAALLSACGQTAERAAPVAPVKPVTAVAESASVPPADTVPPAPPPLDKSWQLLPIGERVGPRPMAVETIGKAKLRELQEEFGEPTELVEGRWIAFWDQYLLYRASPRDTVWLSFELAFDEKYLPEHGNISLKEVDLDGRGAPEAVVEVHSELEGVSSGSRWRTLNVIDVTRRQLLLRTLLADYNENFPGYAQSHGHALAPEEIIQGCERTVQVRGQEVVLNKAYDMYYTRKRCQLPGLRAGHYCYRGGRLYYRPGI